MVYITLHTYPMWYTIPIYLENRSCHFSSFWVTKRALKSVLKEIDLLWLFHCLGGYLCISLHAFCGHPWQPESHNFPSSFRPHIYMYTKYHKHMMGKALSVSHHPVGRSVCPHINTQLTIGVRPQESNFLVNLLVPSWMACFSSDRKRD